MCLCVQHEFNGHTSLTSVNGPTKHQAPHLQTKYVSRVDAVPPVWCSTADDLVNADDFRLAVMKNDLKLIENFLKHGNFEQLFNV